MKKILSLLFGIAFMAPGWGADVVAERATCEEIQAEITVLNATEDLDENGTERLNNLRAQYRRSCQKSVGARRTIARTVNTNAGAKKADEIVAAEQSGVDLVESIQAQKAENCQKLLDAIEKEKSAETPNQADIDKIQAQYDADCVEKPVAEPEPELDAEQVAANLEKGLCADGTKPNKYGCCTGEKFKDLGNLNFACCKEDTNECFPPMN